MIVDRVDAMEAWALIGGEWKELDLAEVLQVAATMTPAEFRRRWPDLPALPVRAFLAGGI